MREKGSSEDSRNGATRPAVDVFMLGRFEIVDASGSAIADGSRPLTLLKLLVALGGNAVPATQLSDALWPHADGYAANRTLITNIHRLRAMIGHAAVLLRGGRLSLVANRCQVDALQLVRSLDETDRALEPRSILRHAAGVLVLYRGRFLAGEFDPPEVISTRTRLHTGFINSIGSASGRLIRHGWIDEAVDLLLRALVIDDRSEVLYRQLMLAYARAGRWSDGIDAYRRCRQTLGEFHGVAPSVEIERLYRVLTSRGESAMRETGGHLAPAPATAGSSSEEQCPVTVVLIEWDAPVASTASSTGDARQDSACTTKRRIGEIIARHGGMVHESFANAVLGVFGVPTAHEDDALRAVRACRMIVRNADGTTHESSGGTGRFSGSRCAVASGLVVTQQGPESTRVHLDGKPLDEVKRLVTQADTAQIVIGQKTKVRVEDYFMYQSVRTENETKPLIAFRITGETGIDSHFAAAKARGLAPFLGRQEELSILHKSVQRAASGEGRTVILSGEPGIGKSRLLYEFVAQVDRNETVVIEAGCRAYGDFTPYYPFIHAVRHLLALDCALRPEDQAREVCNQTRAIAPALEQYVPYYQLLLALPVTDETAPPASGVALRRVTKEAISALIIQISLDRPVLLVLEDWHWVDESSDEILRYLQALIFSYRVLVVVSHRVESPLKGLDGTRFDVLRLGPLADNDAMELVSNMFGTTCVPERFARVVGTRAGGNPFFIEEICNGLRQRRDGQAVWTIDSPCVASGDIGIPETVQGMIRNRLDRLGSGARETALSAAVIGRDFSLRVLVEVHGDRESLEDDLDCLKAQGLIQQTGVLPEVEFRFNHALTQFVAYEALSPSRRCALHERVGRVIERLRAGRIDEHLEALARHFSVAKDIPRAVDYLERAGDKAARTHATAAACKHYRMAIELLDSSEQTPQSVRRRIHISFKWVDISYYVSAHESLVVLARSRIDANRIRDRSLEARVSYWTGRVHHVMGDPKGALRFFRQALAIVPAGQSGEMTALVHAGIGRAALLTCDFAGAVEALETGLAGLDPNREPEEMCYSTSFLAMALAHQGRFERSFTLHEEALRLANVTGDLTYEAAALVRLEISHVIRGDWRAAIEVGRNVVRIAERIENPMLAGFAMFDEGHSQYMLGDGVVGLARCEEGRRLIQESGSQLGFSLYLSNLAELYASAAQFERAADVAEQALARRQTGERFGVYAAYRALALIAEHRAPCRLGLSRSRLAYAHRLASAAGAWPAVAIGRLRRAEMYMRQQSPARAAAPLREAVNRFESMGMVWWLEQAKRLQSSLGGVGYADRPRE